MKTVGIIGGIAPESTIEYYRQILARYREKQPESGNPSIVINSIDIHRMLALIYANDLAGVTDYFSAEIARVAAAGATFALFASNTPHIVFDELVRRASVPLISIVEAARTAVRARGVRKAGLLGTRFTMQGRFYRDAFARDGIEIVAPEGEDQAYVHDKYMSELVNAQFLPDTRAGLLAVIDRLREQHGIEAVILGGTELPLILRESEYRGMPFFDTTRIHVDEVVARLAS